MRLFEFAPQSDYLAACLMTCFVLFGILTGGTRVVPFALPADVLDYDVFKINADKSGNYYALIFLLAKCAAPLGGLTFIILGGVFGYQIALAAGNSAFAVPGLILLDCVVPAVLQLGAFPLIWSFPIDRRRHEVIRRRLAARQALPGVATATAL